MPIVSGTVYDNTGAPAAGRIVRLYRRDSGVLLAETVSGTGLVTPGDPDYDKVSLLLHGNGVDDSTTVVDNSPTPKIITCHGNARISTAQSKFGGASLFFDGSGDYMEVPNDAGFSFGTGDYAIEFWSYRTSTKSDCVVVHNTTNASALGGWWVNFSGDAFQVYCDGALVINVAGAGTAGSVWNFWRLVRASGTVYVFRNNALIGSAASSHAMNSSATLQIGGSSRFGGFDGWFNGHVDDIRLTKGAARSTVAAAPPASPFYDFAEIPPVAVGTYSLNTGAFTGEAQRIVLDDVAGALYNDLIDRVMVA
jgi:hypothetical protein